MSEGSDIRVMQCAPSVPEKPFRRDRRHQTLLLLATLVVPWLAAGCSKDPKANAETTGRQSPPPNFLIYVSDTLRADALGCYGNPTVETPTLDGLAAEGILFENVTAPSSWTRPSMASILTGLYPTAHGADERLNILTNVPRMSELLLESGYNTAHFTTNPNTAEVFGFRAGFEHFDEFGEKRAQVGQVKVTELTVPSEKLHESISGWLSRQDATKPFFILALSIDPHTPYAPPPEFDRYGPPGYDGPIDASGGDDQRKRMNSRRISPADKQRARALYHGDVTYNDHTLGQLIDALETFGQADNTVVVFTSDHGEEFWEHGTRGHGKALYVESVQVPLIWYDPQEAQRGLRISRPVSSVDIAPTVLSLAGVARPDWMQGASLFEEPAAPRALYSELNVDRHKIWSVYEHPWKLIWDENGDELRLYNVEEDRLESRNLIESQPQLSARLQKRLIDHLESSRELAGRLAHQSRSLDASDVPSDIQQQLKDLGYVDEDDYSEVEEEDYGTSRDEAELEEVAKGTGEGEDE